jgi:hypothetical protein
MACCKFHDRLDAKLSVQEYTASACGSLKAAIDAGSQGHKSDGKGGLIVEGAPEYCCFECPLLLAKHAKAAAVQPPATK